MQRVTLGLLACVIGSLAQAGDLIRVKSGETLTLDASRSEWVLDELVLEDGATLAIPASLGEVQIDAQRALFGKNSRILAPGSAGAAGQDGSSVTAAAEQCKDGADGGAGTHGGAGKDGVALSLTLRIAQLDSLQIDTRGGDGGKGGSGGAGGPGGDYDSCNAPKGGNGGQGGDGGDGGSGGHVRVLYTLLPESGITGTLGTRISVNAPGGKGGAEGAGGPGGKGADGRFVNMKTLTGNKKWMAGGKEGALGQAGKPGRDGAKGQIVVQQDLRGRMEELVQEKAQSQAVTEQGLNAVTQDVAALKVTVAGLASKELVQQQGDRLEASLTKINQSLDALQKRIAQMEQQLKKPAASPAAAAQKKPAAATP